MKKRNKAWFDFCSYSASGVDFRDCKSFKLRFLRLPKGIPPMGPAMGPPIGPPAPRGPIGPMGLMPMGPIGPPMGPPPDIPGPNNLERKRTLR